MTFAKHASDRRTQTQIRPLRRAEPHPSQDLRRGHTSELVLSLPRHDARVRPAAPAWSSLTVKTATTLSYYAGHALPAMLLGILCWAVAEILAAFAAYAEAMHSPPAPRGRLPAETDAIDTLRGAKPSLSRMTMKDNDGSAGYGHQTRPGARAAVLPVECPTTRTHGRVSLTRVAAASQSSLCRARDRRRTVEEPQGLDSCSRHDIGVSGCDIEHIERYGARRE